MKMANKIYTQEDMDKATKEAYGKGEEYGLAEAHATRYAKEEDAKLKKLLDEITYIEAQTEETKMQTARLQAECDLLNIQSEVMKRSA